MSQEPPRAPRLPTGRPCAWNETLLQRDLHTAREGGVVKLDLRRGRARRDVEDDLAVQRVPRVDVLVEGRRVLKVDRGLAVGRELLPLRVEQAGVVAEEALRLVTDVRDREADDAE